MHPLIEYGVYFDHDGNGFAERSEWVGSDDGILVRDINGNGMIDSGAELFGDNTLLANGQKADNGFEALADLDSNGDNVFDSNDQAWSEVKVWKDANSSCRGLKHYCAQLLADDCKLNTANIVL